MYLQKLEVAFQEDRESARDYEWMILELYDQATRESPGGGLVECWRKDSLTNEEFREYLLLARQPMAHRIAA